VPRSYGDKLIHALLSLPAVPVRPGNACAHCTDTEHLRNQGQGCRYPSRAVNHHALRFSWPGPPMRIRRSHFQVVSHRVMDACGNARLDR
jgi:hypothetical protein